MRHVIIHFLYTACLLFVFCLWSLFLCACQKVMTSHCWLALMNGWKPDSGADVYVWVEADGPEYVCRKANRVWEIVPKSTSLVHSVRKQPLSFICLLINHPRTSPATKHTHAYTETSAAIYCVQAPFHPLSTPFSQIHEEVQMDRQTIDQLWDKPVMMNIKIPKRQLFSLVNEGGCP